jgi:hypothetical protein
MKTYTRYSDDFKEQEPLKVYASMNVTNPYAVFAHHPG